ncbi:MAG TPA: nicotinamide-nucleotide amidohydrolase family protein [Methylotenera sp.]
MAQHTNLSIYDAATQLGQSLKTSGFMLVMAESCTGGMVAEAITSVAGSSAWFDRGFVSYSNAAKIDMLDVSSKTLEKFGAVSEQTAAEMAIGALINSEAQIAGSITGIAGPDGGSPEKPVGTVCFAWTGKNLPVSTCTHWFEGNRESVRKQATIFMMVGLIERLNTEQA